MNTYQIIPRNGRWNKRIEADLFRVRAYRSRDGRFYATAEKKPKVWGCDVMLVLNSEEIIR